MSTVLYVDDEIAIQRAVDRWLTRRGHVVRVAPNLAAARAALAEVPFDCVFIDVWLAGESGFELQSWIDDQHPALSARTVFVTGDVTDAQGIDVMSRQLGRPVLGKPFELAELERIVSSWEQASAS